MENEANIDLAEANWLRSERASGANTVEVALLSGGHVALRDSKEPEGPVLVFTPAEWAAFTAGVHDGEFDRP